MAILRKILFYIFTIAYIILCPLVLLYAFGYIFNPNANVKFGKKIVETGLISISTIPPNSTVYLDNRRYTELTPAVVRDLLPGKYTLKIISKNYKPWIDAVTVLPGKATALDSVILIPNKFRKNIVIKDKLEKMIPIYQTQFFIIVSGPRLKDYFIYDFKKNQYWPLFQNNYNLRDFSELRIRRSFVMKKSNNLVLELVSGIFGEKKFFWVEIKDGYAEIKDISKFFIESPDDIIWDYSDPKEIFIFKNNYLGKLDVVSEIYYPKYVKGVYGYGIFDRMLYILTEDNNFVRMNYEKKNIEVLYDGSKDEIKFLNKAEYHRIQPLTSSIIIFWTKQGGIYTNLAPYKFVEKAVLGSEFYSDTKNLLIWQKNKIGSLILSKEKYEQDIFERMPEINWFFDKGLDIQQAFWVYKDTHILFSDGYKVYLLSVDKRLGSDLNHLLDIKKNSGMYFLEDLGRLFYLDPTSGNLCYIQMIPENKIR